MSHAYPGPAFGRAGLPEAWRPAEWHRDHSCFRKGTDLVLRLFLGERSWSGLVPQKTHLCQIPGPHDCDLICRKGFCRWNQVKDLEMRCITQVGPKSIRDRGERQCQPTSSKEGGAGWHVGLLGPTHNRSNFWRVLGVGAGCQGPRPGLRLWNREVRCWFIPLSDCIGNQNYSQFSISLNSFTRKIVFCLPSSVWL